MKQEHWHYDYWLIWRKIVFKNTINDSNLLQEGKVFQSPVFFKIDDFGDLKEFIPSYRDYKFYVKAAKDGKQYLIPQPFIKDLPFLVKKDDNGNPKLIEVKEKKQDKEFWSYIKGVDSYNVPEHKSMNFQTYINNFNPMENADPKAWTLLKLIAHSKGLKMGICSRVRGGKNSNFYSVKYMRGAVNPALLACTRPVFFRNILYNDHINIDEVTSWKPVDMAIIEDDVQNFGAGSPEQSKHSLGASGGLVDVDITSKGLTFTFNPITEKQPISFDSVFTNFDKIEDRFPLIYLSESKILTHVEQPSKAQAESVVMENIQSFNEWSSNCAYFYNNMDLELHKYNYSKSPFVGNPRFMTNTMPLLRTIDAYSESQEEFDDWMIYLKKCMYDYKVMRSGGNLKLSDLDYDTSATEEIKM